MNFVSKVVLDLALASRRLFKLNLMFFSRHHHFWTFLYLLEPQDVPGSYYNPISPVCNKPFLQGNLVPFSR